MVALAGGSNTALLAIVNQAAGHIKEGRPQLLSVALFIVGMGVFIYAQRRVALTTSAEVERIVHASRERLIGRLARCELREVEQIGRGRLYSAISADAQTISQTASSLVMGAQSVILIAFVSAYLATRSLTALLLSAVVLGIAIRVYLNKMRGVEEALHAAGRQESELHDLVSGVLDGFKEIRLSSRRSLAALADAVSVSQRTAAYNTVAQQAMGGAFVFGQVAIFVLLGTLVFVTPMFGGSYATSATASLTTIVFLIGPISAMVSVVPQVAVAQAAAANLQALENMLLAKAHEQAADPMPNSVPARLRSLELRRVVFSYVADDSRFDVGPIDLRIAAGETVFITGGNGSGKSTLIKLLTGLYAPLAGELWVNDVPVTQGSAQAYRDRFCAVFSDFHLFRKFYGMAAPGDEVARDWLESMEIADKAAVRGDGFSTIDLSAGQRKRLALISAMFEDKPIVVLDEWAADQDPHFRRKFYEEVLPRMKAAGKTVIAVTHDDRYFHHADRRLHMDEGQLLHIEEIRSDE